MTKKLKQNFYHSFNSTIWNMLIDHDDLYLYLEIRDVTAHQVSFAGINLKNGQLVFHDLSFGEPWWISMVTVSKSSILFKINEDDQNPESLTYFTYNINLQKITWESSGFNFLTITDEGFLGYRKRKDKDKFLIVKSSDGEEIAIDDENDVAYKNCFKSTSENKILSIPFHYLEGSDYFELVKKYLSQNLNILPLKAIDYLELRNAIIISYYIYPEPEKTDSLLENFLLVLDRQGNILLQEKIDENLTGIGLETFFVIPGQLIFTSFKKEVKSYFIT